MTVRLSNWMPSLDLPTGSAAPSSPPAREPGRGQVRALTGNDAVAMAFKQVDPHLTAAYPITPQSELMHKFAEYVAQGQVRTDLITVESEHSAMSVVLAAAAAGCRTFTATSAVGLSYMMEVYQNAGALRLPIVMSLVNRHAGGLLNIHNDHSDAMLARNAAWIQMHAENAQEAYDNVLQAFRIAEDDRVRLPVTVCHDGFVVSHTVERLLTVSDAEARTFVGEFIPPVDLLDVDNPQAIGPLVMPDLASNLYAQIAEAMRWAPGVIEEIGQEYGLLTGRPYGLLESYRMDDAEVAVVAMGSVCGTVRAVVDLLRSRGVRAGLVKLRVFRPFPAEALARALQGSNLSAIAVLDRTPELGSGGPLFAETTAALAVRVAATGGRMPILTNVILGVGGRDVTLAEINGVYRHLVELAARGTHPGGDAVFFMDVGDRGEKDLVLRNGEVDDTASKPARNLLLIARGGQGARTSSYLLAEMVIELGKYAQASPAYGPERTGAPVRAFARVSDAPIDDRQQVYSADVVVVFDETLLDEFRADLERLSSDGVLMVNTRRSPLELREELSISAGRIYTVDATGIAMAELGANRPNTALLAALIKTLGLGDLALLKRAFSAKMKRLSEKTLAGNLRAMDRAAAECRMVNCE
jgi:pyruvate ferredoxin oxidoreductase alpha subunit